jgi:signal transduction histidine kinase
MWYYPIKEVAMQAPLPPDEPGRLRALHELEVLDSPAEADLDDIVALTSAVCGAPVAVVTLIDADRQWFKARVGVDVTETGRDVSFCAHAILGRDLLVVPDTRVDARFADNPYVKGEPAVRFYAGAPLVTSDGYAVGTLCVTDAAPRRLTVAQLRALRALARQVTAQLELRRYGVSLARCTQRGYEIDRVKDDLGNLVSHELGTALTDLRACVELLRDPDDCPPELAAHLGAIAHAHAPQLLRLLDDLVLIAGSGLSPSTIDEATAARSTVDMSTVDILSGPELRPREVDLTSLTEWAVRCVRPVGDVKGIPIRLDTEPGPLPVLGDPVRLGQALSHLLFSAVKFTPAGAQVRVCIDAESGPAVHVYGTGEASVLYEHLYRGAIARRPSLGPGRGSRADAGLAVVRAILDAHHATVALSHEPDAGTTMHIVFPPAAPAEPAAPV